MKKILLSVFSFTIGVFALNAQTLDQSNTASQSSTWLVNSGGNTSNGQSFTAGISGFLSSISINIDATNPFLPTLAGNFTLTVRSGNGYGGAILGVDTFTVTGTEPTGFLSIPIKPSTVAVTAGNSYTYIIDEISGTGQLNIAASNNTYAGGDLYSQVFTNPPTIDVTRDFIFQTYMQASLTCNIADQTVTAAQTTFCAGGGSTTINLGSSETGVNYFLRNNANDTIISGPVAGTGSGIALNTGNLTATTTINVYGTKSSAIDLAANTDIIRFTTPFFAYTNEITIEAWVDFKGNHPRAGQSAPLVDNNSSNVWLWDGGAWLVNDNGNWKALLFPTTLPTGWTHVATVANASGMFIYYNGVLVASNTTGITSGIRNTASSVIELGQDPRFTPSTPGRNTNNSFDNFKVWNTARSASEVSSSMDSCLIGTEVGLVQYTRFEEGTGTTLNSITGVNGTIVNPASAWITGSSVCASCDFEMTQIVTVTVSSPAGSLTSQTNVSCNGGTDGTATVSVSGGTASYTYLWSNGATTATATNLAANTYNVTITDANGCTTNVSNIIITEPTALAGSLTSQTNVNCNGGSTGSATVSATGGTAPYTYLWSNAATTATATNLSAGNYTATITDANGCNYSVTNITITEPTALTGNNNTTICNNESIVINGTTYNAANPTGTEVFTNVGANGCDSTVTVALNVLPAIDVTTTLNIDTLTANLAGADYKWLDCDNNFAIISGEIGQSFTPTTTGNYAVEITNGSCVDTSACVNVIITSIKEHNAANITLYPNPTNGEVTINLGNTTRATTYTIFAIDGKAVASGTTNTNTIKIDLSAESKGIYFVKINSANSSTVHKLIKQ